MAPNTIWVKDVDAIRAFGLIKSTMWIYKELLSENGKLVVKVFMGPWFEEFVAEMKTIFGWKNIKVFKPLSCRKESKETYVIKYR
jgi:23S rRNA (uridine2552-2'-O)-methyltransferase